MLAFWRPTLRLCQAASAACCIHLQFHAKETREGFRIIVRGGALCFSHPGTEIHHPLPSWSRFSLLRQTLAFMRFAKLWAGLWRAASQFTWATFQQMWFLSGKETCWGGSSRSLISLIRFSKIVLFSPMSLLNKNFPRTRNCEYSVFLSTDDRKKTKRSLANHYKVLEAKCSILCQNIKENSWKEWRN